MDTKSGVKSFVIALLLSLPFLCGSLMANSSAKASGSPDMLVLRSQSSFSSTELSIDLSQHRAVKFRICPEPTSCSDRACGKSQRQLSTEELQTLLSLARDAKLFDGQVNGGQIDLAFHWLEVHAHGEIALLVATLNDSFSEPGPRNKLLVKLIALEEEMATASKGQRCR